MALVWMLEGGKQSTYQKVKDVIQGFSILWQSWFQSWGSEVQGHSGILSKPRLHKTHSPNSTWASLSHGQRSFFWQQLVERCITGQTAERKSICILLPPRLGVKARRWGGVLCRAISWTWLSYWNNEPTAAVVPSTRPTQDPSKFQHRSLPLPLTEEFLAMDIC